jgi:hypothetical protein
VVCNAILREAVDQVDALHVDWTWFDLSASLTHWSGLITWRHMQLQALNCQRITARNAHAESPRGLITTVGHQTRAATYCRLDTEKSHNALNSQMTEGFTERVQLTQG